MQGPAPQRRPGNSFLHAEQVRFHGGCFEKSGTRLTVQERRTLIPQRSGVSPAYFENRRLAAWRARKLGTSNRSSLLTATQCSLRGVDSGKFHNKIGQDPNERARFHKRNSVST